MRQEVKKLSINFNQEFLKKFSSNDYKLGILLIKENKSKDDIEYQKLEKEIMSSQMTINDTRFNNQLRIEVLWHIDKLIYILNLLLRYYRNEIVEIKNYNNKTL